MQELKLSCDCVGGKKHCGWLSVIDFEGGAEINLFMSFLGMKKCIAGVYLHEREIEKLKDFLNKL